MLPLNEQCDRQPVSVRASARRITNRGRDLVERAGAGFHDECHPASGHDVRWLGKPNNNWACRLELDERSMAIDAPVAGSDDAATFGIKLEPWFSDEPDAPDPSVDRRNSPRHLAAPKYRLSRLREP